MKTQCYLEMEEIIMYTNFKDLHKAYGFNDGNRTRDNLSYEEEKSFVKDCNSCDKGIGPKFERTEIFLLLFCFIREAF